MRARLTRAEQQQRTRDELVAAAERRFTAQGFHATSVEQVAADAGFTKGAVYSNFASKEDLFFAVYERRAQRAIAEIEQAIEEDGPLEGVVRLSTAAMRRRESDDGWLAAFFEFWAHVIRHPEHRARFAAIHGQAQEPLVAAVERFGAEQGRVAAVAPDKLTAAVMAMQIGLSLERLTRPELIDPALGGEIGRLVLEHLHEGERDDGQRTPGQLRRRRTRRA